jgi:hypothetical protein
MAGDLNGTPGLEFHRKIGKIRKSWGFHKKLKSSGRKLP